MKYTIMFDKLTQARVINSLLYQMNDNACIKSQHQFRKLNKF